MKNSLGTGYLELGPESGDTYTDWAGDNVEIEDVFRFDPDEGCWEIENANGDRCNITWDDGWVEA